MADHVIVMYPYTSRFRLAFNSSLQSQIKGRNTNLVAICRAMQQDMVEDAHWLNSKCKDWVQSLTGSWCCVFEQDSSTRYINGYLAPYGPKIKTLFIDQRSSKMQS